MPICRALPSRTPVAHPEELRADRPLRPHSALFFIIYPTTSFKISAMFQCITLDDEEESRFLRADFSVDCKSAAHTYMTFYAVLMLFVYPLGMPTLYSYLLYARYGKQMHRLRDIAVLRATIHDSALSRASYEASKPPDEGGSSSGGATEAARWSHRQAAENAAGQLQKMGRRLWDAEPRTVPTGPSVFRAQRTTDAAALCACFTGGAAGASRPRSC